MISHDCNTDFLAVSAQCVQDKLAVADSSASRYTCGSSKDKASANYSNGDVSVHFTTDGSGSGSGFILTYKLIDKPVSSKHTRSLWHDNFRHKGYVNGNKMRQTLEGVKDDGYFKTR